MTLPLLAIMSLPIHPAPGSGVAGPRSAGPERGGPARRVIIDADTGIDDAVALWTALRSDRLDLVGVTTVAGNTSSERAALNSRLILDLVGGQSIPVVRGSARSLGGKAPEAFDSTREGDGIGGIYDRLRPAVPEGKIDDRGEDHALNFLERHIREHGRSLTIICTGPTTNLARLLRRDPRLGEALGPVLVMGGGFGDHGGNIRPDAEFNASCDPEALDIVVRHARDLRLFPLNLTEPVRLSRAGLRARAPSLDPALGEALVSMTGVLMDFQRDRFPEPSGRFDGMSLHDVHPVVFAIRPSAYRFDAVPVRVDTDTGSTVAGDGGTRINVAKGVDEKRFFDALWSALSAESGAPD